MVWHTTAYTQATPQKQANLLGFLRFFENSSQYQNGQHAELLVSIDHVENAHRHRFQSSEKVAKHPPHPITLADCMSSKYRAASAAIGFANAPVTETGCQQTTLATLFSASYPPETRRCPPKISPEYLSTTTQSTSHHWRDTTQNYDRFFDGFLIPNTWKSFNPPFKI